MNTPTETPFSKALHYCLSNEYKKITPFKLAEITGVSTEYISMMRHGKRNGREEVRRKIAEIYGETYDDFLDIGKRLLTSNQLKTNSNFSQKPGKPQFHPPAGEKLRLLLEQFDKKNMSGDPHEEEEADAMVETIYKVHDEMAEEFRQNILKNFPELSSDEIEEPPKKIADNIIQRILWIQVFAPEVLKSIYEYVKFLHIKYEREGRDKRRA